MIRITLIIFIGFSASLDSPLTLEVVNNDEFEISSIKLQNQDDGCNENVDFFSLGCRANFGGRKS